MSRPYAAESAFRAIADPTRRKIIDLLRGKERTGLEIAQTIGLTKTTLSHHLGVLREASLVTQRRAGRQRIFHLQPQSLRFPAAWLQRHIA